MTSWISYWSDTLKEIFRDPPCGGFCWPMSVVQGCGGGLALNIHGENIHDKSRVTERENQVMVTWRGTTRISTTRYRVGTLANLGRCRAPKLVGIQESECLDSQNIHIGAKQTRHSQR